MTPAGDLATYRDLTVHPAEGIADPEGFELPGLPEGLLAVAFRQPLLGEFYVKGYKVGQCEGPGYEQALVIKAAKTHCLRYDILGDTYRPVKI